MFWGEDDKRWLEKAAVIWLESDQLEIKCLDCGSYSCFFMVLIMNGMHVVQGMNREGLLEVLSIIARSYVTSPKWSKLHSVESNVDARPALIFQILRSTR
jgi:hypothetical protein